MKRPPQRTRGWEGTKPQKQPLSSLGRGAVLSIHRAGPSDRPDLESSSLAGSALRLEASCCLPSLRFLICKM